LGTGFVRHHNGFYSPAAGFYSFRELSLAGGLQDPKGFDLRRLVRQPQFCHREDVRFEVSPNLLASNGPSSEESSTLLAAEEVLDRRSLPSCFCTHGL